MDNQVTHNKRWDRFDIFFDYDDVLVERVKTIPDRRFHDTKTKGKFWSVPATPTHADQILKTLSSYSFVFDRRVKELAGELEKIKQAAESVGDRRKTAGRLYPFQEAAVEFLRAVSGRGLLADEMGLGKAQPLDAKVLTPWGWKKMGDMREGDWVCTPSGQPTPVRGVYDRGKMDVYEITFSDGSSTRSTMDHLWNVRSANDKYLGKDFKTKTLQEISSRLKDAAGNRRHYIPITKPLTLGFKHLKEITPYVMGALLGDGGLRHSVLFSSADEYILNRITEEIPDELELKHAGDYDYRISSGSANKNSILTALRDLQLMGKYSYEKFIPSQYKYLATAEDRIELLRGLMDTDGSISNAVVEFCSSSEQLAMDVAFLVQSLGGVARISKGKTSHRDRFRVIINLGINPFSLPRKASLWSPREKYGPSRGIESVELIGKEEVRCIEVLSRDGLYITDECIVTHNTVECLAYIDRYVDEPVLVVAPASVIYKWKAEAEEWLTGDWTVEVVEGSKGELPAADILIMSYAIATRRYTQLLKCKLGLVVFDECHRIKNKKTQRSRAAKLYTAGASRIICLSGTPFLNRPLELYNILKMLDPKSWKNFMDFAKRYCGAVKTRFGHWDFSGATNQEELAERLKSVMIRRLKVDVLDQLPELTRAILPVSIKRTEYNKVYKQRKDMNPLAWLNELRQIVGRGKAKVAVEWAQNFLDSSDEKLVLYAHHKEVISVLEDELNEYGTISITGDTPNAKRKELVDEFQEGSPRVAIISSAGGEGIDLFAASSILFVEREWSPLYEEQIEARLHRMGQENAVTAYYLAAIDTVDEHLADLVDAKRDSFHRIVGAASIESIIREELLKEI